MTDIFDTANYLSLKFQTLDLYWYSVETTEWEPTMVGQSKTASLCQRAHHSSCPLSLFAVKLKYNLLF